MGKKILFSPVGGTDPMSEKDGSDGALLHIARHYKPDVIYLYLSKEILDLQKDDRYEWALKKLSEKINHNFQIEVYERPELEDVQLFDPIYEDMEKVLDEIISKMEAGDELLLNISSGTPAMKSALLVLSALQEIRCQCIQVKTPQGKMNKDIREYPYEELWEKNINNTLQEGDKDFKRSYPVELLSLKRLKYEEVIKKYISEYDYHAALVLAETMEPESRTRYIRKLRLAEARRKFAFESVDNDVKAENADIYCPIAGGHNRYLYEYMLNLQVKVKKGEYDDFIRAISPIISDLFERILRKQAKFDLKRFTYKDEKDVLCWVEEEKLKAIEDGKYFQILNDGYGGKFNGGWVKSDHLVKLANKLIVSNKAKKCVNALRKIEESVRNLAAHNMVSVSNSQLKKQTGYNCNDIIKLLKEAFTYTSCRITEEEWESYDRMNEDIIKAM